MLVGPNSCTKPSWKRSSLKLQDGEQQSTCDLDIFPDRNDRTPPQTPRAASLLSPRDLSTTAHERTASPNSPHSSSLKRGFAKDGPKSRRLLRVSPPHEVEAMLSVQVFSRAPRGPPHTRLPAQERNGLTRNPSVDDLAVGMGHLQQGKSGRHLTNDTRAENDQKSSRAKKKKAHLRGLRRRFSSHTRKKAFQHECACFRGVRCHQVREIYRNVVVGNYRP